MSHASPPPPPSCMLEDILFLCYTAKERRGEEGKGLVVFKILLQLGGCSQKHPDWNFPHLHFMSHHTAQTNPNSEGLFFISRTGVP